MKLQATLLVLVLVTLGLTAVVAARQTAPAHDSADVPARLAAIEQRLDGLEQVAREARDEARRAARTREATRAVETHASPPPSDAPSAAAALLAGEGAGRLQQELADRVERQVEQQLERLAAEERHRGADGKWKPPLDELSRSLGLDDRQSAALREIFDRARDEAFELLRTPRADGRNALDDLAADLHGAQDKEQVWGRFLVRLTSDRVPGRSQTYLGALIQAGARVQERVDAQLGEEQRRRFRALQVDLFGVETGYDPAGVYVLERLAEMGE